MTRHYFGTDGIRGTANQFPMTPDIAMKAAMAVGLAFRKGGHRHRAVIGKDTRLSGYMLEYAMVAGFTAVGVDVFLLGPIPTPAVAQMTRTLKCDIGVMISASHNPFADNGIKIFGGDGFKLSDDIEREIEAMIESDLTERLQQGAELGRAKRIEGATERYIEYIKSTLPRSLSFAGTRVVIDCANGAAYKVAPTVLWELGAEVVSIGVEPNGTNINDNVGSTAPDQLVAKVRELRADVGIALDGDADRLIMVDETGAVIDGDQLMATMAISLKQDGLLSRPAIVATIMSNLGLERYLASEGIELLRSRVGDRYVLEKMHESQCNFGGEQSGHLILSHHASTGDGLLAAMQIMAAHKRAGQPLSQFCRRFTPVPQILKNVRFKDGQPLDEPVVRQTIADAVERLSPVGRLVVRPSGTEPLIRVMGEGDDENLVGRVVEDVCSAIRKAAA